ncbi:Beta-lactam-inducible penicillin-binding protein [Nocardioides dokdonensis FR1436]|uniref:Beta-lactam-inducible penicillin-binding protein n=1 Tax=Nocardioides dokdonensis FR1436 TaxID=1300347 RepID=A0A1A9GIT2_9ACTN|nr:Beta-lactam-inducible penicillin-binding protein [Nocardioides dokdonensis FR1436]
MLALTLVATTALSACDQVADQVSGPDPRPAAEAYAAALAAGEPGAVPLAEPASAAADEAHQEVVAGLEPAFAGAVPRIEVLDVRENDDDVAEVDLAWTWSLPVGEWAYETSTSLRLVDDEWRAVWQPAVVEPSLGDGEVLDASTLGAERGDVRGAGGARLVTARPVMRFGVDRGQVSKKQALRAAGRLAALAGLDAAAYRDRVAASGDEAFVEAIVYRRDDVPSALAQGYPDVAGVVAIAGEQPLAPTRDFAAALLGSVGEVTAEMIEADPDTYRIGDQAGLSGLQARYDEELQGTPGVLVRAVEDGAGSGGERELLALEAVPGEDLRLTLDAGLQREAERLLSGVGPASALVALRPSTGEVLAAANGPGSGTTNVATYGQAAPGSTSKIVTSLALLRAGLTPDSTVPCTPRVVVDGKAFKNYSDYPAGDLGDITLRRAIASSCNTALIARADKIDGTDLYDAAATLGLGIDHDLGFPAYFGSVPQPGSDTEAAASLIGQGKVLASPMAMAAVVASVQEGTTVVPTLVEGFTDDPPEGAAPLTKDEAADLRSMLRGVVTDGSGRGLADLPGPDAIAKTGTAEFARDGKILTHAWMVAAQGDLAVAVYVEVGDSGSGTAGPILESFLRTAQGG